ncbi:MAG: hypothetical protein L3J96_04960, partial [Thermoplasmata archaeon]|nr:hypothetical protein [Thermoplasmata archaeon]
MSENERHDVRSIVNGRWAAYCTSGAALAITMMMVLVPAASGTTIIHPFKGWGPTIQLDVGKSGCTTSKATHAPTWAKKSGTFRFAGYSNSPNCPKAPVGGSSGQADGDFGLYGILHFASSGNYTVTANWSVTYSAMWNLTPYASCKLVYTASYSTCDSYAEVTVYSYLFMTDESNSTWGTYGYGYAIGGFVDDYNYT